MKKGLSYSDAVKLLGGGDSRIVAAIDKLAGGILLAASAGGAGLVLSLFDAKAEFARLSADLVSSLSDKFRGLDRYSKSERLTAALAVLVLVSYFEELDSFEATAADDPGLPYNVRTVMRRVGRQKPGKTDQVSMVTGQPGRSGKLGSLVRGLLHDELPVPMPQYPYEVTLGRIRELYGRLSAQMAVYVVGPEGWDALHPDDQKAFLKAFRESVSRGAAERYEELFRRLAADFPEAAFWANLVDHQATRGAIRDLRTGLEGLERVLNEITTGRAAGERRDALARSYRAALEQRVLETGEVPAEGLRIPALGEAYVNPAFRVAEVGPRDSLHLEQWWDDQLVRDDFQAFLLGYLTSPQATISPLVLLGQPGSGKSLLTKVLAARLPAREFLTIRVVLREVPADADLQSQIEYAIRDATRENLTWPDLVSTAGDALPVVMLDGFDELLQATGVSQSDYLEKIALFQEREAVHGHPVAVIVTSRTAVADRARIPPGGAVSVRLEAFSEQQVTQWLEVWNEANAPFQAARNLQPLDAETVLEGGELARQPLLLLMLALYDADGNALRAAQDDLGHAQLYERLIIRFAEREVRKTRGGLDDEQIRQEIERELLRLSAAAFAMFNRNRQWATERELNNDLDILLGGNDHRRPAPSGFRAPLSAAQIVIGHFFFIHQAQAVRDDLKLTTCEFLHATFGEFLVARLVARELDDLARIAEVTAERSRADTPDDGFLYALLSFASLSARATTVEFLTDCITLIPPARRVVLRRLLLTLFRTALDTRLPANYSDYEPVRLTGPARAAAYSANLLVLLVLTGGEITGTELFPAASDTITAWRQQALLWRSQLSPDGWSWLATRLDFHRIGAAGNRDIVIASVREKPVTKPIDPYWSWDEPTAATAEQRSWLMADYEAFQQENYFLCDVSQDAITHALEQIASYLPTTIMTFAGIWDDRCVSAAHALLRLWIACGTQSNTEELTAAYDDCIDIALGAFAPFDTQTESRYRELILRQLGHDKTRLPGVWRENTRQQLEAARDQPDRAEWAERVIIKLGFTLQ
jgi:AAA domain (dynein-related subfamily)